MVRQTREQVNDEILEAAALTFAAHGYERTAVQQLADAVGYSKTGLLHRFPSKQALHDAVLAATVDSVERILEAALETPMERRRSAVLGLVVDSALEHPGLLQLLLEYTRPESAEPGGPQLRAVVARLVDVLVGGTGAGAVPCPADAAALMTAELAESGLLGAGVADPTFEARMRAVLGLKLAVEAVRLGAACGAPAAQSRELVVHLAAGVVGVPDPAAAHPTAQATQTTQEA